MPSDLATSRRDVGGLSAPARVDVVIVTWNHADSLPACLSSLGRSTRRHHVLDRVVVVDNASEPACTPGPTDGLPAVELVTNHHNAGFAGACNQGARDSRADYLLFLNPDARVGPGAVDTAVSLLESDVSHRTAIAGVQLVDEHGTPQATCGRFPGLVYLFWQITGLTRLSPSWFRGMRMLEWDHRQTREVDFVSGACLLIRREVFDRLGGFDERLFVYLEDADLALRARALGCRAIFCADASVVHPSGWATGRDRAWRLAQSWRSLVVYGRKHFSPAGAIALLACVVLLAPAARLAHALLHRSAVDAAAAGSAWVLFWRLLKADALGRTASGATRQATQETTAAITPRRHPVAGRQWPARGSSTPADGVR